MTTISNYKELIAERTRIEEELRNQKLALKAEINEVKSKLEPITDVIGMLGLSKVKQGGKKPMLQTGLSMGIDLLVRDNLLSKAGWATRAVLPVILKGLSKLFLNKISKKNNSEEGFKTLEESN